jgi:hypothetical protein
MGAMTALAAAAATVAAGASIYGGMEGRKAAKEQEGLAREQSAAGAAEIMRQTGRTVDLENRNITQTVQQQELGYLASGVTLEGSPLLMMEETRRLGAENIEEIKKAGAAGSTARIAEGEATAKAAKASGRAALIGGITGAAQSASSLVNFVGKPSMAKKK